MIEKLTLQEEEAMLIVWKLDGGFIKDFLNEYPEPKPPYTTLASIVKNLERKSYVQSVRYGNTYLYRPQVDEKTYKTTFISGFVKDYFANSYKELVSFFAREEKISPKDLKEIIALIGSESEQKKRNNP